MSNSNGCERIGIYVADELVRVYQEIAGLMGIPAPVWSSRQEQGTALTGVFSECAVILADGISLPSLKDLGSGPLILICGPVQGENPGLRLKTMPFNLGCEGTRLLMEGRDYREAGVGEPVLDQMLEELRQVFRQDVGHYLELPPIPWGHAYALTLTHDLDILSLKEMPVARTFLGYFYRSSLVNWKRWRSGKVRTSEFTQTLWEMARTWAAKIGLGQDVWQRALPRLLELEKALGVRSSLYFMPFPGKPGMLPAHPDHSAQEEAPANRASFYDVAKQRTLLSRLEQEGWEAGVHGIDAWYAEREARAEHQRIARLTGQQELGVRMHWLYFDTPASFRSLEQGGFLYDATFGYNEVVGFRAGTLQPYHPLNCRTLWELPLHIQDGALLGEEHLNLSREEAFAQALPVLAWAKRFGGAVSLLWHNQSFTAPRFWGEVYERLIKRGQEDGAWIAVPRDILSWFTCRRECRIGLTREGTTWKITCTQPEQGTSRGPSASPLPPVRVRLYLNPRRIRACSAPYETGESYVDFAAQPLVTLQVEGEELG
ncbi:hypothetical protein REC12_18445 [Desulfosporosinus sp. PR]|uniref:hypothetical protein n=1 Tax=Candidatus Desulfosporosinus nitrosoreducens TaxID=3401928 RepID=UPI0027F2197C|nr:hypothetical protein [Desulfosporosinus sp. PR]MDQ7095572.1 hypothetical protein [Desulfosporosinus sp. PR]